MTCDCTVMMIHSCSLLLPTHEHRTFSSPLYPSIYTSSFFPITEQNFFFYCCLTTTTTTTNCDVCTLALLLHITPKNLHQYFHTNITLVRSYRILQGRYCLLALPEFERILLLSSRRFSRSSTFTLFKIIHIRRLVPSRLLQLLHRKLTRSRPRLIALASPI
uniref:Uncharacterized protein n=1 Tax=Leptocylindrus danicus TaxID=163516 RepID=A0A7S2NXA6_9STRA